MNIVIFGPPGAGKGTQSKFIVEKYKLHQLSTGDLLRNEIKNKTELGSKISTIMSSGELVSDDIVGNLIEKFISKNTFKNKIIFDGIQNHNVAKNLDNLLLNMIKKSILPQIICKSETVKQRIWKDSPKKKEQMIRRNRNKKI